MTLLQAISKVKISIASQNGHETRPGNRACFVHRVNSFAIKSVSIELVNSGILCRMLYPLLLN